MLAKKSGLDESRGAGIRDIVAAEVMSAVATRTMMKSLSTARVMQL